MTPPAGEWQAGHSEGGLWLPWVLGWVSSLLVPQLALTVTPTHVTRRGFQGTDEVGGAHVIIFNAQRCWASCRGGVWLSLIGFTGARAWDRARGARDLLSKCSGWGGNYKGLREAGQRRGRVQARPWFQVNSPWSDDRRRRQVLRQRQGGWRLGSAALATWQHVGVVCGGRAGGDCSAPHGGTRPLSWAQDPLRASAPLLPPPGGDPFITRGMRTWLSGSLVLAPLWNLDQERFWRCVKLGTCTESVGLQELGH